MTAPLPVYNEDGCLPSQADLCEPGPFVRIDGRLICLRCARAAHDPRLNRLQEAGEP